MGPLSGVKVVEIAGIGPGPMCAMLLADLGATVIRVSRATPAKDLGWKRPLKYDLLLRNRKSIRLDLKRPEAIDLVLRLVEQADAVIEGFRPGVMERLGLGPDVCLARNPKIVFGRITGWGQTGPLANVPGHDLNYIALAGALHSFGREGQPPTPPMNLLGDFGGGAIYLAFGVLAAILEARSSGKGQVVDAAMVDGVASLMTSTYGMFAAGMIKLKRGTNRNDSGSYHYEVYQCADGEWISIAANEKRFHAELLERLDLRPEEIGEQTDAANWPRAKQILAERFKRKTRAEWCSLLEGTDCCFAPVLSMAEAPQHPHLQERETFISIDGVVQPAPAPRFSRTPASVPLPPAEESQENALEALAQWLSPKDVDELRASGLVN